MSKIICDVCGTSYPDTAPQCPICGYVNAGNQTVSGDTKEDIPSREYTYVKGGRFSKSNVRKRNQSNQVKSGKQVPQPVVHNTTVEKTVKSKNKDGQTPKGLIITAVALLLAIIAVIIYISVRFFAPITSGHSGDSILPNVSVESSDPSAESKPEVIPCENVKLDASSVTLDKAGASRMIYATASPADTTDTIAYESSNPEIATVSANGKITAVAPGQAVITVTCGKATVQCTVECTMEETTENTTEATTESEESKSSEEIRLNRADITFSKAGDSWILYSGEIGKTKIQWTSDDTSVAKFEGGKVTAVGSGTTKVYAEYNGQKASCIIRCIFKDSSNSGIAGNGGVSEDGGGSGSASAGNVQIYGPYGSAISDATIKVGENLQLVLKDASGKKVDAAWKLEGSGCTLSGSTVTGVTAKSSCSVSATYNGTTYHCVIRVSG